MSEDFKCCSEHGDFHAQAATKAAGVEIPGAPHPIRTLVDEHDVILAVLEAMEKEITLMRTGGVLRRGFWLEVVEFLENFADRCHHGKEEDLLFPAIVERGIPEEGGPVGVMKKEHIEGRQLVAQLKRAVEAQQGIELAQATDGYVGLLREHIRKENEILFPLAVRALDEEAVERLNRAFERFEHVEMSEGTHCRFLGIAQRICVEHDTGEEKLFRHHAH